jgi:hypothetical protein
VTDRGETPELDGPLCPPLAEPAVIAEADAFVVLATVSQAVAEAAARKAILRSVLRPEDIGEAVIGSTRLAYVPLWRIEVDVHSHQVRVASELRVGNVSLPIPATSRKEEHGDYYVEARSTFPFPLAFVERTRSGSSTSTHHTTFGRGISIRRDEMTPRASAPELEGELIEPDVPRDEAERAARRRALSNASSGESVTLEATPSVRSVACCHFPIHVTRYRYSGHANVGAIETYWVVCSGRSAKIVASRHPSIARSVARKLRKLITFGR